MTEEIRQRIGRPSPTRIDGPTIERGRAYVWANGKRTRRATANWNAAHPDDPWKPGEIIHHIDSNKLNDDPTNLAKLANQRVHAAIHFKDHPKSAETRARMSAAQHRRFPITPRPCETCGQPLTRYQQKEKYRFCSQVCYLASRR